MKLLEPRDIERIHSEHVMVNHTREYMNRYLCFPIELNDKPWRWEGKDLPRVMALLEFRRMVKDRGLQANSLLTINGVNDPELAYLPYSKHHNIEYLQDPERYDLHKLNLDERNYDFIICNQTLEHLVNPIACLENLRDHLSPGGYFYTNVPANNIPHEVPFHYYTGFTPVGLGALCETAGLEIVEIGQWGNIEYMMQMMTKQSWPDFEFMLQCMSTPGKNEPLNPIITWALSRRAS